MITPRATDASFASVDEFFVAFRDIAREDTVECAAEGGLLADRLGYAFAGGYEAALSRLARLARLEHGLGLACLCATEQGGAHPRAIETRIAAGELSGQKTFATLAGSVETLLVVATVGDEGGRRRLRVVAIPRDRAGVRLEDGPKVPFAPEIAHHRIVFDRVRVADDEVLPGDGYDDYLKPFRTLEDIHVLAATLGYVVGRASGWPSEITEDALSLLFALRALNGESPKERSVHLALGSVLRSSHALLARTDSLWTGDARARWERDRPLLLVASNARQKRLEAARSRTW